MKKEEREAKERSSFQMYSEGKTAQQIARDLAIDPMTVGKWKRIYKWDKRKEKIDKALKETEDKAILKFKKQQVKVIMALMQKVYSDVTTGETKGNARDFILLQDKFHELTGHAEQEGGFKFVIQTTYDHDEYLIDFIKSKLSEEELIEFEEGYKVHKVKDKQEKKKREDNHSTNSSTGNEGLTENKFEDLKKLDEEEIKIEEEVVELIAQ